MIHSIARNTQTKKWYLVSISEPDARDRCHFIYTPADIRDIRAIVAARDGMTGPLESDGRYQRQQLKPLPPQ